MNPDDFLMLYRWKTSLSFIFIPLSLSSFQVACWSSCLASLLPVASWWPLARRRRPGAAPEDPWRSLVKCVEKTSENHRKTTGKMERTIVCGKSQVPSSWCCYPSTYPHIWITHLWKTIYQVPSLYLTQSISIANGVVGKDPCLNPLAWINPYICWGGISYMLVPESGLSYWLHDDSHSVVDVNHVTANKPHIFCFESHSFARSRTGCWDHFLWKIAIQFDESHLKSCVFSSSQEYI